jgi:hypothetical protein
MIMRRYFDLIIFSTTLEISLGMVAHRAYLRSLLSNMNMTAVRADPNCVTFA